MRSAEHCAHRWDWSADWRRHCARVCAAVLATAVSITGPSASVASAKPKPRATAAAPRLAGTHRSVEASHRPQPIHRVPVAAHPAAATASLRGEIALHFALEQRGKPYVYGGTGPWSYDCSGLAQRAWRAAGVAIPRTTQEQARTGSAVPLSQIKRGDLVIFYRNASHVGIYAGNGTVVVAPHQGTTVTIQQMKWMPIYAVRRPR